MKNGSDSETGKANGLILIYGRISDAVKITVLFFRKRVYLAAPIRQFACGHIPVYILRDIMHHLTRITRQLVLILHQIPCAQSLDRK